MIGYRTRLTYSMNLQGTPEQVFPLFCPVREHEWIETWKCEMIYSDSGYAELDCVFKTNFPREGPEDTWVVSRYEPPHLIEFVHINALRAVRKSFSLTSNSDGSTRLNWTMVFTGLSPEGNKLLPDLTHQTYNGYAAAMEQEINHYLSTGEMLRTKTHK